MAATAAAKAERVRVAMSTTPLSAPFIIADEMGYFTENGLDVELKEVIGGHRAIRAVFKGEADLATSSEAVVMFNSFERADFAVLCTFVSSDNDVKIITRRDSGIERVGDLAGHRVGTILGASAQFFLDETLVLNGINRSTMEIVHVNPETSPEALELGDVDAVVTWEPFAYLTLTRLGNAAVVVPHDRAYIETFNAIVMRDYAKRNQDVLRRMVRALIKASDFLVTRGEESQRMVAKRLGKDLAMIQAVWGDFSFGVSLHQWLLTTLEAQARWAVNNALVADQAPPNYLDFLLVEPLEQLDPQAVTIFR
jgi:NitT/TauT family transport system substrate-binding protein